MQLKKLITRFNGGKMRNVLSVAYLGDAVYELHIRAYLINSGTYNNGDLQKLSLNYVSAASQKRIILSLIDNDILTKEEYEIFIQGRNAKGGKSKTADIVTYRIATGLEYLFGTLYLENKFRRIEELIEYIVRL